MGMRASAAFGRSLGLVLALALAGCVNSGASDRNGSLTSPALASAMLTAANPEDAVTYFRNASAQNPDRIDLRRGLAQSLVRAGRAGEAVVIWQQVIGLDGSGDEDRLALAEAQIRAGDWDGAEAMLATIPPTFETFERYRIEAMIADYRQRWDRADSFYETAAGLTTTPASVLNNWGYSKLVRGDVAGAQALFVEAITYDPDLFTAKNNLVLARAEAGDFSLPLVRMTQIERAQLLHTMALAAIRQGRVDLGRGLLSEAIDTHPQHFEPAVSALRALESEVRN